MLIWFWLPPLPLYTTPAPLKPSSVINKLSSLPYLVKIEYLPSFKARGPNRVIYLLTPTYFILAWTFTCHIVRSSLLLVYGKTFLIYPEWCQKKPEKWWMNGKLVFYNEATQTLLGLLCMTLSLIRKKILNACYWKVFSAIDGKNSLVTRSSTHIGWQKSKRILERIFQ